MGLLSVIDVTVASEEPARLTSLLEDAFGWAVSSSERRPTIGVGDLPNGRLRVVRADGPSARVKDWDTGARLLSVYSRDTRRSIDQLAQHGIEAGAFVVYEPFPGRPYHECVVEIEGVLRVVLPQPEQYEPSPAYDADPNRLHSELHNICLTVPDLDQARDFFVGAGEMIELFGGPIEHPEIREMMALPEGSTCSVSLLAGPSRRPARLELLHFTGVDAADVSHLPLGVRSARFAVDDVQRTRERLLAAGAEALEDEALRGPAGLTIELQRDGDG